MNAKTSRRKTKATASRVTAKPAAVAVTSRKPAKAATALAAQRTSAAPPQPTVSKATVRSSRAAPPAPAVPPGASKQARLIVLLQAGPGATIDQMMTLTGWQAHTVRGTISGVLRKKLGLNVACQAASDSGSRVYRIIG
jgi:hypothetical protein